MTLKRKKNAGKRVSVLVIKKQSGKRRNARACACVCVYTKIIFCLRLVKTGAGSKKRDGGGIRKTRLKKYSQNKTCQMIIIKNIIIINLYVNAKHTPAYLSSCLVVTFSIYARTRLICRIRLNKPLSVRESSLLFHIYLSTYNTIHIILDIIMRIKI